MSSGRSVQQRIYALYILSILRSYSTGDHPLSISEIKERIEFEFPEEFNGKAPDVKTIRNQLNAMIETIKASDSLQLGFSIECCIRDNDRFIPVSTELSEDEENNDVKKGRSATKYYYYQSIFEDSEISMLMDSLEAHNYLSAVDISELVIKLSSLAPGLFSEYSSKIYTSGSSDPRIDNFQAYLLENLRILHEVIGRKEFAYITKYYYDKNMDLIPESYEPVLIRPLKLMFNNGYYYLIAVQYSTTKKKYFNVHYRVDRIGDIEPHKPTRQERIDFKGEKPGDPAAYRLHHPVMYGDDLTRVRMYVTNTHFMLNTLADYFGSAATITELDDNVLEVSVTASIGGMHLFAMEYCANVRIVSPAELADRVKKDLSKALFENYND